MIKLYQFEPAFGLPNASPFCMKLETYLRMTKLPFEIEPFDLGQLKNAPKGKLPYIDDEGQCLCDTSFIIDHLKLRYGDPLDAWLSVEQKAIALAFQRLIEENLYWAVVHTRWVQANGWAHTKAAFFDKLALPLKWIVPPLARRGLIKELHGHGMGRHKEAEIHTIGQRDISAIVDFLGDKPFFMGYQPSSIDATVYAFLANLIWPPVESPLKQHAKKHPQVKAYCERMKTQYYG